MPAANIPSMVSPAAPSPLEINLRRLMAKCDAKVRSSDKILQGSELTKYMMNIKMLRELLADLEDELNPSAEGDNAVLKEYVEKIDSLEAALDGTAPPNSRNLLQTRMIAHVPHSVSGTISSFGSEMERGLRPKPQLDQGVQQVAIENQYSQPLSRPDELLGLRDRRRGASSLNIEGTHRHNGLEVSGSRDALREQGQVEAALQNDRAQKEEMEAGLSILMQQLRHNAMAIQQTLADEQKSGLLDDADQALDNNISRLGKERARLELYSKQSRKTKWLIWGIVLGVSLVFVFMFFIIRIF
ncbi:hypothetical protein BGX21_007758 [Mortierella sp. AD011]|nr:hypothetical protein BGX20_007767 [Mortierella sp. AD010]KAF9398473.1 hypothetical protein BGX21_007758 [Mortierella sp. AD011]